MIERKKILIVEDEDRMRHLLELVLTEKGYQVASAGDGIDAMKKWRDLLPDVVLTDLRMPRADGMELLDFRNRCFKQVPLILLTAFGTVQNAVTAMKQGAFDYLTKPIDNEELVNIVARALAQGGTSERVSHLTDSNPVEMIGSSATMKKIWEDINLVSRKKMSVLITGESGTGKELVAQAIHSLSDRHDKPLVRVNCAAIPHNLLESELFGHCRGAFTDAVSDRKGAFTLADGGTLFLDEIGDLPLELQPKLLHAVEDKQVTPVGAHKTKKVDVKIIAATNQDLDVMVEEGRFRSDLYYRLNMFQIALPALRERGGDVLELVEYYLDRFCREEGKKKLKVMDDAIQLLSRYAWPGNVRELRHVLERLVLINHNGHLSAEMLPEKLQGAVSGKGEKNGKSCDLATREKRFIVDALEQCAWNQSQAARRLGISRNTLRYRMKKYDIAKDGQTHA